MTGDRHWLAIDTATDLASVAVGSPPVTQAAAFVQGARQHAAQILALVEQVLAPTGVRPKELAGIVLGDGPGSFTGLRIGWAAAKGLAQETGLPLRTVPSLMAAAAGAARVLGGVPRPGCTGACHQPDLRAGAPLRHRRRPARLPRGLLSVARAR